VVDAQSRTLMQTLLNRTGSPSTLQGAACTVLEQVKVLVDPAMAGQVVVDETGGTVAVATILTMVRKLDQS